tara:strand:+ start:1776 stop:3983 length:2208 start_codon:yes stop_codon:yes gene_type:complete
MYSFVESCLLNAATASILAGFVFAFGRLVHRPAITHVLWIVVLIKLVTPPIVDVPVGIKLQSLASIAEPTAIVHTATSNTKLPAVNMDTSQVPTGSPNSQPIASADMTRPESTRRESAAMSPNQSAAIAETSVAMPRRSLSPAIGIKVFVIAVLSVWAIGTFAWFGIQGRRIWIFLNVVRSAPIASKRIQQRAAELATRMGLRRAPQICVLDATVSPILFAIGWRARILFPATLLQRLDDDAQATLLTHELAHFYRGDHWVRLLEFVVTGLFWWHPVVWIARREIEVSEEHCCDAWVVDQFPEHPRTYVEALLDTIDFLSEDRPPVAPITTGLGQVSFLRARVRIIMSGVAPKSMSTPARAAIIAMAAVMLAIGPNVFDGAMRRADASLKTPNKRDISIDSILAHSIDTSNANEAPTTSPSPVNTGMIDVPQDATEDLAVNSADSIWGTVNSHDGRYQVRIKANGTMQLVDTMERRSHELSSYQPASIAFVPHREQLLIGSLDSSVYLIDCASIKTLAAFTGHPSVVASVAVSRDGRTAVSGCRNGVVKVWDIDYQREIASRLPKFENAINGVRFSPDGRLLAIASGDWVTAAAGSVAVWDLRGGTMQNRLDLASPVAAVAFDSAGLTLANWNGETAWWDLHSDATQPRSDVAKDIVSLASIASDTQANLVSDAKTRNQTNERMFWFERMDRSGDGQISWSEFDGSLGAFRNLDLDHDGYVSSIEVMGTPATVGS